MSNKRKKGQTLNEFVLAEMEKYYIEKNSKNIKNMRNKINYLVATNPRLKKLKVQLLSDAFGPLRIEEH